LDISGAQGHISLDANVSTGKRAEPRIDSLQLVDVLTVERRHVVHVFYDQSFQGAIHEAASTWRAKLGPVDLGDFFTVDEARGAVAKWFAEFEANSREEALEEGEATEFSDIELTQDAAL